MTITSRLVRTPQPQPQGFELPKPKPSPPPTTTTTTTTTTTQQPTRRAGASGGSSPSSGTTQTIQTTTTPQTIVRPTTERGIDVRILKRKQGTLQSTIAQRKKRITSARFKRCPMGFERRTSLIGGRRVIKCVKKKRR